MRGTQLGQQNVWLWVAAPTRCKCAHLASPGLSPLSIPGCFTALPARGRAPASPGAMSWLTSKLLLPFPQPCPIFPPAPQGSAPSLPTHPFCSSRSRTGALALRRLLPSHAGPHELRGRHGGQWDHSTGAHREQSQPGPPRALRGAKESCLDLFLQHQTALIVLPSLNSFDQIPPQMLHYFARKQGRANQSIITQLIPLLFL